MLVKSILLDNVADKKGGAVNNQVQIKRNMTVKIKGLTFIKTQTFENNCFGCILGSFIGDSVGSYLEFSRGVVSDLKVNKAMLMPGGGPHQVNPG